MVARSPGPRASGALALAGLLALAGCFGPVGEPRETVSDIPTPSTPLENATTVFEPPFPLTPPDVGVSADRPGAIVDTHSNLTFTASWPPSSGVDASKIATYVWSFGDGEEDIGRSAQHRYSAPGAYDVEVRVEDVYGRVATGRVALGVADNRTESGLIAVGNGAQDAVPFSPGANAYDHRDFDLALEPGARSATFTLRFDKRPAVQGQLVPAEANNLVLKVLDADGAVVATAGGAANPKTIVIEGAALEGSAITFRVSGDSGFQVPFSVTALVLYGGGSE